MAAPTATPTPGAQVEDEEYYSSWSLFLVCLLLILSLWTSYYLQIKRIRAVHETGVSIFAGMAVGLIVRLSPGSMIRDMLVSAFRFLGSGYGRGVHGAFTAGPQLYSAAWR
jgi:sodium/hydrogen exchanger-like protein 6/7